jgi:hypothetical protein
MVSDRRVAGEADRRHRLRGYARAPPQAASARRTLGLTSEEGFPVSTDSSRLARRAAHLVALAVPLALALAGLARAEEVVVKGRALEGSIAGVTADGVQFETVYGKGAILIPWADVEQLRSETEFLVLYGDDEDATGPILGIEEGALLIGQGPETAERIPLESIFRSLTREQLEGSPLEAMRARYRFWNASFDLAFAYTDATTDTVAFATAVEVRRKKKPTDLNLGAYYRYGTTRTSGQPKTTNEDRLLGRARLDYDLFDSVFAFGAVSAEYDDVQSLSIRTDPNAGLGWRFIDREDLVMSARSGLGYVYQRYFGGTTEDFFTVIFGGDVEATLPLGSKFRAGFEYLPSVSDWTGNYLLRGTADWSMPIIGMLDFKLSILDNYNNRPAAGTKHNSFTSLAGLSLRF